jgi:hypothetical protein
MMLSRDDIFSASGNAAPYACNTVDRWLYNTPFGLPVVPLV